MTNQMYRVMKTNYYISVYQSRALLESMAVWTTGQRALFPMLRKRLVGSVVLDVTRGAIRDDIMSERTFRVHGHIVRYILSVENTEVRITIATIHFFPTEPDPDTPNAFDIAKLGADRVGACELVRDGDSWRLIEIEGDIYDPDHRGDDLDSRLAPDDTHSLGAAIDFASYRLTEIDNATTTSKTMGTPKGLSEFDSETALVIIKSPRTFMRATNYFCLRHALFNSVRRPPPGVCLHAAIWESLGYPTSSRFKEDARIIFAQEKSALPGVTAAGDCVSWRPPEKDAPEFANAASPSPFSARLN